ncbi:MAG: hypothetical protein ACREK3_05315 [Gemmatimonadota bacterium]
MVTRLAVVLFTLAIAGACSARSDQAASSGSEMASATHWHTKVYRAEGGKEAGQKSIAHTSMTRLSDESTRASVTLPGLLPSGTYAWGVYEGSCETPGRLMGSESDYPVIEPDENSMGSFTAVINDNLTANGDYVLQIFTTGGSRDTLLGCAGLRIGTEDDPLDEV